MMHFDESSDVFLAKPTPDVTFALPYLRGLPLFDHQTQSGLPASPAFFSGSYVFATRTAKSSSHPVRMAVTGALHASYARIAEGDISRYFVE